MTFPLFGPGPQVAHFSTSSRERGAQGRPIKYEGGGGDP